MNLRFYFILLGLSCTLLIHAQAEKQTAEIISTYTRPVIDGVIDEIWKKAEKNYIVRKFRDEQPSLGQNGDTWWKIMRTKDGVYILINVADDSFFPSYIDTIEADSREYDKPELYFDVNYTLADGKGPQNGPGHYYFAPGFTEGKNNGTIFEDPDNHQKYAFFTDETNYSGYIAEYFIPWKWLIDEDGLILDVYGYIGFDITINDRDQGDLTVKHAVWANEGLTGESMLNMDDCGLITCPSFNQDEFLILLENYNGAIKTDNGTFQIKVYTPDVPLKYTVVNESGRARINNTGLVEGLMNGTVKVIISSFDDTYIDAHLEITITNQKVTLADLSVITNGFFDLKDSNGHAEDWSGWGGDASTPLPQISSGIAVCTPVKTDQNFQYQFSNSHVTALKDVDYLFKMKMWADAERTVCVDFESQNNISTGGTPAYTRYGVSTDPESTGQSEWTWNVSSEPKFYTWHVNFDRLEPSIIQKVQYMLGLSGVMVYIDSVTLVAVEDYNLLPEGINNNPENNTSFSLYPNPLGASNILNISLNSGNARVIIYNSAGIIVKDDFISGTHAIIDLSSCPPGLYFVKVNNEIRKLVKVQTTDRTAD